MNDVAHLSRRRFVRTIAVLVGGSTFPAGCDGPANVRKPWHWRAFSDQEALLVDLICEQIIPADEDPGASEAGVVNYIDRQLAPQGRHEDQLESYRLGLCALQDTCRSMYDKPFEQLSWDQQTESLRALESNQVNEALWQRQPAPDFFAMIREHTIEGFFGHPRHGGNQHLVAYRMLAYEYPEIRGQNRYSDPRFRKYLSR